MFNYRFGWWQRRTTHTESIVKLLLPNAWNIQSFGFYSLSK